jgi:Mlc titration factor MtfA (ptsG expression regulator)
MPPQDTIYIPGQTGPPPATGKIITDTVDSSDPFYHPTNAGDTVNYQYQVIDEGNNNESSSSFDPSIIALLVIIAGVAFFTSLAGKLENLIKEGWKKNKGKTFQKTVDTRRYQLEDWLNKYNPYFKSLSPELRNRFLLRTVEFMDSKDFRFHSMLAEEYIPVLISATAVQLTFGLRNYRMDYFDVIHIMRSEYVLNIDQETYYGHVSKNGIHVSWDHFMEGYSNYTDSENVGLHEMAHALSYDVYLGFEDSDDRDFKRRLNEFVEEARPVFREMRQKGSYFFDDYSLSTFDEFWATSAEIFFENPQELKNKLPLLYREISGLLNQDPLSVNKILDYGLS